MTRRGERRSRSDLAPPACLASCSWTRKARCCGETRALRWWRILSWVIHGAEPTVPPLSLLWGLRARDSRVVLGGMRKTRVGGSPSERGPAREGRSQIPSPPVDYIATEDMAHPPTTKPTLLSLRSSRKWSCDVGFDMPLCLSGAGRQGFQVSAVLCGEHAQQ